MKPELRPVASDDDWQAFHAIRERVLWLARGVEGYDRNHPDDRVPENHPFLLLIEEKPAGVIRVDLAPPIAWLRRVAVAEALQRRGLGSRMIELAAEFARSSGCPVLRSTVDRDAVGFYRKLGFEVLEDDGGSVLMTRGG